MNIILFLRFFLLLLIFLILFLENHLELSRPFTFKVSNKSTDNYDCMSACWAFGGCGVANARFCALICLAPCFGYLFVIRHIQIRQKYGILWLFKASHAAAHIMNIPQISFNYLIENFYVLCVIICIISHRST